MFQHQCHFCVPTLINRPLTFPEIRWQPCMCILVQLIYELELLLLSYLLFCAWPFEPEESLLRLQCPLRDQAERIGKARSKEHSSWNKGNEKRGILDF